MREIAEAVIQSLLEHHLLSRPLKTPPCSRETLWISHSVVHSLRVPCPQQIGACQPEEHLLKQLYLVSGCSLVPSQIQYKAHLYRY